MRILAIIFISVLLAGCFSSKEKEVKIRTRISIESNIMSGTKIKVWIEGKDGDVINGALVSAISPENIIKTLTFDSRNSYYYEEFSSIYQGIFKIKVNSNQLDYEQRIDVPNYGLQNNIKLSYFMDEKGNDAINDEDLTTNSSISVGWNQIPNAKSYRVEIKSGGDIVYSIVSDTNSAEIEKGILTGTGSGKMYTTQVSAQYQAGDPFYQNANYFSTSSSESIEYTFYVKD